MNFLPIVSRELRVVSRKSWMYWVRVIFALAGVIAALLMFFEGATSRIARGEPMLWVLARSHGDGDFLRRMVTADASIQRTGGQLGPSFLTPLKGLMWW